MKAVVIRAYRDKNTKTMHDVGKVVNVTKARYGEINGARTGPHLEEVKKVTGDGNAD